MAENISPAQAATAKLDVLDTLRFHNLQLRAELLNKEREELTREFMAKYLPGVLASGISISADGTVSALPAKIT